MSKRLLTDDELNLMNAMRDNGFIEIAKLVGKTFGKAKAIAVTDDSGEVLARIGAYKPDGMMIKPMPSAIRRSKYNGR